MAGTGSKVNFYGPAGFTVSFHRGGQNQGKSESQIHENYPDEVPTNLVDLTMR